MARLGPEQSHDSDREGDSSVIELGAETINVEDSEPSDPESEGPDGSDGSEASEGEPHHGFLDTEALDDSASESDDSEGSEVSNPYGASGARMPPFWGHPVAGPCSFPQFIRLPIELRELIWNHFCDDLSAVHRVLDFELRQNMREEWKAHAGSSLLARTTASRAMLSVYHETRALYLKRYPHQLIFSTEEETPATFHFNKQSDIILTSALDLDKAAIFDDPQEQAAYYDQNGSSADFEIPGFSDKIVHLGLELPLGRMGDNDLVTSKFFLSMPNLEAVYPCINVDDWALPVNALKWCVSDHVVSCYTKTEEIEPGLGEDAEVIFLWHDPDVECDEQGDCAALSGCIGPSILNADFDDEDEDEEADEEDAEEIEKRKQAKLEERDRLAAIKLCPMRVFFGDSQVQLLDTLRRAKLPNNMWDQDLIDREIMDDDVAEPDSFLDNYESDGIDDATVLEPETDDEEGTGIEDDTLAMELGMGSPGSFAGFSPVEGEIQVQDHSVYTIHDSSEEEDEDEEEEQEASPPRSPTKRQRGRQIIEDDSDEEEVGDESVMEVPAPEPSRGKKRSRVILSDDEEEEEADIQSRPSKRARPVVIDDEDEEDDEDVQEVATKPRGHGSNKRAPVILSDSEEDDSEEEEEEEEEEEAPKRLSLVERLRLHREANPIEDASEEGSGSDDENDYTRGTYDEDSGEGEGDSDDLVLGMADDGEDEDEGSYY
ncbi:hypothetical protein ACHAQH_009380 [Verticillium albo-atrum]